MSDFVDSIHPIGQWKNSEPFPIQHGRTRPLLLFFWRSHTPESVHVLHDLDLLVREHGNTFPADVLAIHAPEYDPESNDWEDILEHFGISLPVLHDPHYHTWERFGVQHAPSYILLDASDKEYVRRVGSLEDSNIVDHIWSQTA